MKRITISLASIAAMLFLSIAPAFATAKADCCGGGQCCSGGSCCHRHK
jgi:hypothetical protein